ncbi:MAG: MSCRAMM family protein [Chlamydiota bacterium]
MAAAFRFRLCLQAALICVFLLAAAGSQGQVSAQSASYTLSGTVVNSVTGEPIRRALVQVGGDRMQLTDSQGHFELSGLGAGSYSITAQKPGFFAESRLFSTTELTMLDVNRDIAAIVVKLIPEGIIFGHIADENDDPLEGVFVRARDWRIVNGRRRLEFVGGQSTDEDGRFRFFGLMPGTYYVVASSDLGRMGVLPHEGYATTYYPGVTQLAAASPIKLAAGQKVQADFVLRRHSMFRVTGQVTGYSGGTLNSIQLTDPAGGERTWPPRFDSATGAFVARGVPPGSYRLEVVATDRQGHALFGEAAVNVAANVSGIVVAVAAAVSIPVIVETDFTGSAQGDNQTPVSVHLAPVGVSGQSFFRPEVWSRPAGDKEDGGLVIPGVQPGRYYAEFNPNGNWYVQSATSGSTDLFTDPLTVSSAVAPIQVLLRDDGATLAGEVRSRGVAVSGTVLAVMQDEPLRIPWMVRSNPQGEFHFENLPPGDYVVLAFANLGDLEYANRDALRDYLSQGTHVTLGSKDAKAVTVELIGR